MKKKIEFKPGQVRLFWVLLDVVYAIAAILWPLLKKSVSWSQTGNRWITLAVLAGLTLVFAWKPGWFFPAYRLLMIGFSYVGDFLFAVISFFVFYLILTPISLLMRLSGKKFMAAGIDRAGDTYYENPEDHSQYENQF